MSQPREPLPRTVTELADTARDLMETRTRTDGTKFWTTRDDAPEWLSDLCRAAHADMLPDDHRYSFIVEALDGLAENENPDDYDPEPDIYTHDRTAWLHSRADRYSYVDDAVEDYGHAGSVIDDIGNGQAREKREVLDSVRASLEALIADLPDPDDDDDDDDEPEPDDDAPTPPADLSHFRDPRRPTVEELLSWPGEPQADAPDDDEPTGHTTTCDACGETTDDPHTHAMDLAQLCARCEIALYELKAFNETA